MMTSLPHDIRSRLFDLAQRVERLQAGNPGRFELDKGMIAHQLRMLARGFVVSPKERDHVRGWRAEDAR